MYDDIVHQIVLAFKAQLLSMKDNRLLVLGEETDENWQHTLRINNYCLEYSSNGSGLDINDYKAIIVAKLSVNTLTCLSNMQSENGISKFIMDALLLGKRIIAIKEGVEFYSYENTASIFLYQELLHCESRVMNFGLTIVDSVNLGKTLTIEKNNSSSRTDIVVAESVINEHSIKNMLQQNSKDKTIVVKKNTVITPLAYDYIMENNVIIVEE